jgi:protoporphyrinogen/coproporphyrinogen III oxidase
MKTKTNVIIIGAGLTGLTLGYYLKKKGIDFVIVEKESRPGGVIRTIHEGGFTFETGPNTGVLGNLEVMDLFEDLGDLCTLEVANPEAKKRLIWKEGRWHCLPGGLMEAVKTPLFSFRDKLRILGEPFRPAGKDPMESVASLVKRRMGKSFLEYAVDPFISGIYAGDPDRLITQYALPKLYKLEQTYGSFIKGAIQKKMHAEGRQPSRDVFSVLGGLENLVHALVASIGEELIHCGIASLQIEQSEGGYCLHAGENSDMGEIHAPIVISTVGAHGLRRLFPFFPVKQLDMLSGLEYARIVQVVLGFKNWQGANIKAFGGLVPGRENRKVLGILFTSSFLKDRAPEGGALLNVFMGGARHPEYYTLDDQHILELVEEEVKAMMRLTEFSPDFVRIFRYRHAIPQYGADSAQRIETIQSLQSQFPGIILAGNLHEGIGMADRVAQAVRIAGLAVQMVRL